MATHAEFPRDDPALGDLALHERLSRTWATSRGLIGWLSAVDHKTVGRRSLITALAFFTLGGLLALLMRVQLVKPDNTLVGPDLYNQLFSMHG